MTGFTEPIVASEVVSVDSVLDSNDQRVAYESPSKQTIQGLFKITQFMNNEGRRLSNAILFAVPAVIFVIAYVTTDRIWQDYVLLLGTLLIAVVMVPTLLDSRATVPRTTSIPGAMAVLLFVIGFVGLELWLTAAANAISLFFWLLVGIFRAPG